MKEFIEKLIERLEERIKSNVGWEEEPYFKGETMAYEDAIEIVNQLAEEYGKDNNVATSEYEKGYEDGVESVRALLPYEEKNAGWIPCSEKLPEYGVGVLLQDTEGGYEFGEMVLKDGLTGFWDGLNGWWTSANHYVAWMPLPEPYRTE